MVDYVMQCKARSAMAHQQEGSCFPARTTANDEGVGELQAIDLNAEVWTARDPPIDLQHHTVNRQQEQPATQMLVSSGTEAHQIRCWLISQAALDCCAYASRVMPLSQVRRPRTRACISGVNVSRTLLGRSAPLRETTCC
jgi:hypothetical protein